MDVRIQLSDGDRAAEYAALWKWLRAERELAGRVRAVRGPAADGELGDELDVIALAVSSVGVAVAVAQSLSAYLAARRRSARPDGTSLVLRRPDGEELRIESSGGPAELEPLIREFLERGRDDT